MLLGLSLDRGMADQVVVFAAELPGQVLACTFGANLWEPMRHCSVKSYSLSKLFLKSFCVCRIWWVD